MDARVVFDAIAASKAAWKIKPAGRRWLCAFNTQFSPTQLTMMMMMMMMMIGDAEDEEAKMTYDEKEKDRWTKPATVRRQAGPSQVQAPLFHGPSRPDALDDELNSLLEIWSFGRW